MKENTLHCVYAQGSVKMTVCFCLTYTDEQDIWIHFVGSDVPDCPTLLSIKPSIYFTPESYTYSMDQ